MGFNQQFKKLEKQMAYEYEKSLARVNIITETFLLEHIDENMYRAYTPVKYERTYNFRKSIRGTLNISSKKMESIVYFDRKYLNHRRGMERVYVPYLIQQNEPVRSPRGWAIGARRDTSFYAQTTLVMMQAYYKELSDLQRKRLIF